MQRLFVVSADLSSLYVKRSVSQYTHTMELPTTLRSHERAFLKRVDALVIQLLDQSSLSVGNIAEGLGMNTQKLRRRIQSMLGISAIDYITEVRLDYAKHLLIAFPERPVQEIAVDCGFIEAGNFIRAFRHKTGITPQAYRDQYLE